MSDAAKKKIYKKVWLRVKKEYLKGYVVTERNLQGNSVQGAPKRVFRFPRDSRTHMGYKGWKIQT